MQWWHSMKHAHVGESDPQERHSRILTQGTSSFAKSITDSVVIKDWNLFLLTEPGGQIPIAGGHGLGLYYHDCRYLNGYELKLGEMDPNYLGSQSEDGYKAVFQLANPDLEQDDGRTLARETLGIRWERALQSRSNSLVERMTVQNFGLDLVEIPIELAFRSEFEDIMLIRQVSRDEVGLLTAPDWADDRLNFLYAGKDGLHRSLTIEFSETPDRKEDSRAVYHLRLGPREKKELGLTLCISESRERLSVDAARIPHVSPRSVDEQHERELEERREIAFHVRTSSILFDRILSRSVRDLVMLQSRIGHHEYLAAGIPWFATLFGRDSLLASCFTLGCAPEYSTRTARILAHYQGTKTDDFTEEAPGKILHELRMGELANLRWIVHTPYYGTVDATPLFVLSIARHFAWSGDLSLFEDVKPAVDLALEWIDRRGDSTGDGICRLQIDLEVRTRQSGMEGLRRRHHPQRRIHGRSSDRPL